jgi:hypothetical protein
MITRMAGVVEVVKILSKAGELRQGLWPEVVQLEILLTGSPIFMQEAIGAALLEVVPDEETVLGITLDGRWR